MICKKEVRDFFQFLPQNFRIWIISVLLSWIWYFRPLGSIWHAAISEGKDCSHASNYPKQNKSSEYMREFHFLLFLFSEGNCLQSSEVHAQTDQKLIFNTPYLGFKKVENGSSALTAILKISVMPSYLAEVLEHSCISLSCQTWPYWMMSYAVPRKRDRVLLLRETCPDRGVRDNLLHSIQDSALYPWSCLLSGDRQLQDVSRENWAHRAWWQTCPEILTFGMKSHSPFHESFFGLK